MQEDFKIEANEVFSDDSIALACRDAFGIKYMFPWQRLVVANIMDAAENQGEEDSDFISNQIVLLPTGAGKSLCFQTPALVLKGPTLVIYPLLALMSDQERRMNEGGLKTVVFRGGQTAEERKENFRKLREENYRIIIANPEVLENDSLLKELSECKISHIAIDEAHTVSEWGNSFRKSYLNLGNVIKKLNVPVVTAFTATASPEVLADVSRILFDGKAHIVRSESDRSNIHYYVYKVASKKSAALFLAGTEEGPMIIFCSTRRHAEDMSREINLAYGDGTSKFYHAGLERDEKTQIEKWFFDRKDAVLCATCAFGMGVDKSDIRTVVHLDPPETAESYIQEAGRGGRDRNVANAIMLWNYEDSIKTRGYEKKSRKAAVREFSLSKTCRRQKLLDALGAEQAVCSGCDICDRKKREEIFSKSIFRKIKFLVKPDKNLLLPGERLPIDSEILFSLVKKHDRFYTEKTLEKAFLEVMNYKAVKETGVSIWGHSAFIEAKNQLIYEKRIRRLRFFWKGRYSYVRKIRALDRKIIRFRFRLRHRLRKFPHLRRLALLRLCA